MANEKRLIDANELDSKLDALAKKYAAQGRFEAAKDYSFVQTVLLAAPTVDAVEVVRCKDCTFCKVDNSVYMRDVFGNENDTPQYHCLRGYGYNKPDHFCSYGERRADV